MKRTTDEWNKLTQDLSMFDLKCGFYNNVYASIEILRSIVARLCQNIKTFVFIQTVLNLFVGLRPHSGLQGSVKNSVNGFVQGWVRWYRGPLSAELNTQNKTWKYLLVGDVLRRFGDGFGDLLEDYLTGFSEHAWGIFRGVWGCLRVKVWKRVVEVSKAMMKQNI